MSQLFKIELTNLLHRAATALSRRAGRAGADTRGVAAVEFALILPVMLLLYIGTAELTSGLMANRKMTLVARAVSDLVAQEGDDTGVSAPTLTNVFNAASGIMSPYSTTNLKISVSSIKFVPNAAGTSYTAMTVWSVGNVSGATLRPCGNNALTKVANTAAASSTTMPSGLYTSGTIIVADVKYTFSPNFGGGLLSWSSTDSSIPMSHTTYMKPRTQDEVKFNASSMSYKSVCSPAPPATYN
ncbi:MAG: TadE/TadG family type IV pilus assembly protein [Beijerinckiaceae bacterium]